MAVVTTRGAEVVLERLGFRPPGRATLEDRVNGLLSDMESSAREKESACRQEEVLEFELGVVTCGLDRFTVLSSEVESWPGPERSGLDRALAYRYRRLQSSRNPFQGLPHGFLAPLDHDLRGLVPNVYRSRATYSSSPRTTMPANQRSQSQHSSLFFSIGAWSVWAKSIMVLGLLLGPFWVLPGCDGDPQVAPKIEVKGVEGDDEPVVIEQYVAATDSADLLTASSSHWYDCQEGSIEEVDLLDVLDDLPAASLPEQQEQIRDWIWQAVRSRHLARNKKEVPRHQRNELRPAPWSDAPLHPSGLTRSVLAPGGKLLMLVATDSPELMWESILREYDEIALDNRFSRTRDVVLYRHGRLMPNGTVKVCQLVNLDGDNMLAEATGFRSKTIGSHRDLARFLDGGVDLLSAKCTSKGLEVFGRQRATTTRAPISASEVSELAYEADHPSLEAQISGKPDDWGFSLDPVYDEKKTAVLLRMYAAEIEKGKLDAFPSAFSPANRANVLEWLDTDTLRKDETARKDLAEGLRTLADIAENSPGLFMSFVSIDPIAWAAWQATTRQCPRYIGAFEKSESGKVMFYTDLLMKLTSFGLSSAPASLPPATEHWLPRNACNPDELNGGRLWLDFDISKTRKQKRGALRFMPVATVVLARSFISGLPTLSEQAPRIDQQVFINRWNSSYEEIAAWEPQYERLNQLQKWVAVVRDNDTGRCNARYSAEDTYRASSLPAWIKKNPSLKWTDSSAIGISPVDECLPLLESEVFEKCGESGWFTGGVGLTDGTKLQRVPKLTPKAAPKRLGLKRSKRSSKSSAVTVESKVASNGTTRTKVTQAVPPKLRPSRAVPEGTPKLTDAYARSGWDGVQGSLRTAKLSDVQALLNEPAIRSSDARLDAIADATKSRLQTADQARQLRAQMTSIRAERVRAGQSTQKVEQIEMIYETKARRLKGTLKRRIVPSGTRVSYTLDPGAPPRPGNPKVGVDYVKVSLDPTVLDEGRGYKTGLEVEPSKPSLGTPSAIRSGIRVAIRCDHQDAEGLCGESAN